MAIYEIKDGNTLLARHITADEWDKGGLNFFSSDSEFIQVGTWGYDNGKHLHAHEHNTVPRNTNLTQETLYIKQGKIKATIYNLNRQKVAEWTANEGDILILLRGGHSYDILANTTQVLEVKNGPYLGANADRVRYEDL